MSTQNQTSTAGRFRVAGLLKSKTQDGGLTFRHLAAYLEIARAEPRAVLEQLSSSLDGLPPEKVEIRLAVHGTNEVVHEKRAEWHRHLLKTFYNPFILLLVTLALISFATNDFAGGTIIAVMVLVSVVLTFFQEYRSSRAAEKLRAMVSNTVTVTRAPALADSLGEARIEGASRRVEISISELVPGDIVHLSAGDMIPADVRLLSAKDLFVSQSSLTGEALPVEKSAQRESAVAPGLLEQRNICFAGSSVVSGTAVAVVVRTGSETYLGSLARNIAGQRVLTSFDKGIHRFTWLMIRFMGVMVPLVFVVNGLAKGNWLDAFMFALAVAVGLTPEMLPMIVTVNLAKGALAMARKKVVVKRLNSIQNFGAMDVLCTDKTGTLTQDKVILEKYVDTEGERSESVLKYAYLNSFHQTGLKNLLDRAVLRHVEMSGSLRVDTDYRKIDEIPFDFSRRRMSVVVEERGQRHVLICKGALEEVLGVCAFVERGVGRIPISEAGGEAMREVAHLLSEDGLRVIAVAVREIPIGQQEYAVRDEEGLTLVGFIAFLDPPKETAARAIAALHQQGVRVKVLTGDSEIVTQKICGEVGLSFERILLGHEIEAMSDPELAEAAERSTVFARLTPAQKQRLILAMHAKGHVVGFMGDGINDAPALRSADVGISVDNAVDIAKESADIILLEKSLLILEEGVIEGRKIFGNIVKYIKMGASSNFGNMFSVLGASVILPFLPMLPVQILAQNLLYDLSQTAIPFDRVDEEYVAQPRRWEIGDIGRFMIFIGPISSIFDYTTFALMWFVFKANAPARQGLFQSGWFVEGLLSQTLIVHMIRTRKIPFLQSRAALPLALTTLIVMAVGILVPFSPLAPRIGFTALPSAYFPWLVGTLIAYALLTQLVKSWYIRRYGFN